MSNPTYGNNNQTVHEQMTEFVTYMFGEYEVQTVEVTQITSDGAIQMTVVPDGIGSIDYMWILSVIIILGLFKGIYDLGRFFFSFLIGSRTKKRF